MNYMSNSEELYNVVAYDRIYEPEKILMLEVKKFNIDFDNSIFYMQNLFLENKNPRLFVFNSDKVIVLSIENKEDCIVGVQFCRKEEIVDFWYGKKYYDKEYQITFSINKSEYILTPKLDTNSHHASNYNEIAEDIINYFIN